MRRWLAMLLIGGLGTLWMTAQAQPGDKKAPPPADKKGPMFPPVNPAIAKLEMAVTGLDGPGFDIAYGSESGLLVVGCEKGTLQIYKKETLAALKPPPMKPEPGKPENLVAGKPDNVVKGHEGPVRVLGWFGGPTLVSVGVDKKINFWKMPETKVSQTGAVDTRVRAGAMSPDGKSFATGGESDVIQLWDVAAGKPTTKLTDKMDWTIALAFSSDGKQLLSGDYHGVVRLWDVAGSKKIAELPAKPVPAPKVVPEPIATTCVAFAPDGKAALLGSAEGPIHFVNLADGKIVRTFAGHSGPITGMVFHPSGTLLATCSKDRTVKLWNPAAPAPLKSLDGHTAWIEGITFIENSTKLATVGADQTIRIWDLAEPVKEVKKK